LRRRWIFAKVAASGIDEHPPPRDNTLEVLNVMAYEKRLAIVLVAVLAGCGGKVDEAVSVLGVDAGAASGEDASSTSPGSPGTPGQSGGTDSGAIIIGTSDGGGPIGVEDASFPPPEFDADGFDAGGPTSVDAGGPVTTTISCGNTTCDGATQECCVGLMGGGGGATCVSQGSCAGISLACTSAANCASGDVCCISLGGGGASCATSCSGGMGGNYQLCSTDAECPAGDTCQTTPFGVSICRGQGGGGGFGGGMGGGGMGGGTGGGMTGG
jgi:hypothetical protein